MGRYAIRPLDERDIAIPRDTASFYAVVAEWNWDRNYDGAIRFEKQGYTPRSPKSGVAGDRVLPDAGEGFLSTTSGARMRLIRSTTRAMRRTATARPCASTPPCGSIPTPATGSGSTTAAA